MTTHSAAGQWMGKQTGCYADSIEANPNRPTVSNPAHVTQFGVMELEYGLDRTWPQKGMSQTSDNGLLKLDLLCDVVGLEYNVVSFSDRCDRHSQHVRRQLAGRADQISSANDVAADNGIQLLI